MKLSAPIYHLKRNARRLSRDAQVPLHDALDQTAAKEGYTSWSLLAARHAGISPAEKLYDTLIPGDLVLVGARPRQGKTLLALDLAAQAVRAGKPAIFFTLDYTEHDVRDRLRDIDFDAAAYPDLFRFDCSDRIYADYIVDQTRSAPSGTLVVIDYLQLLDQKRENPPLARQLLALQAFAQARGIIMVFISQIDRTYDAATHSLPGVQDIRLPNQIDLGVFTKTCFLNNGMMELQAVA